jgi:hypothetical protein
LVTVIFPNWSISTSQDNIYRKQSV